MKKLTLKKLTLIIICMGFIAVMVYGGYRYLHGGFSFLCTSDAPCPKGSVCVSKDLGPAGGWRSGSTKDPGACRELPKGLPPICLSSTALIKTPNGEVKITDLQVGDIVLTLAKNGQNQTRPILKLSRTGVPNSVQLIRVKLEDNREILISPHHPTVDGRRISDLRIGDLLDDSRITSLLYEPYTEGYTYDILPVGETGYYWANGILLGSTLK